MRLIRVPYGKKGLPWDLREYKVDGVGPVGTIAEIKEHFPNETSFEIIDNIE